MRFGLRKYFALLFLLLFLFTNPGMAQVEFDNKPAPGIPTFQYELVNVRSPKDGRSRLNLYLQIDYDELQFVKVDSGYMAEYEVSASIMGKEDEQVDGKIWSEKIFVKRYEDTNSRELVSFTMNHFVLDPGKYRLYLSLVDNDSKQTRVKNIEIELREFPDDKLSVSDVTMISQLSVDSLGIKSIRPLISGSLKEDLKALYVYYEIYSPQEVDSFTVEYEVKPIREKKILDQSFKVKREGFRTLAAFPIDSLKISSGRYVLKLKVNDGKDSRSVEKVITIRWSGLPYSIYDIETAIEQLKYIASSSDLKNMKNAKRHEKGELFKKFWEKRDPTPGTEKNEHMIEYYRRIHLANESFSGFREGWKSDMGMVFIILGEPSDIERHPFESGSKPYQIWTYYEINREFVFVDETGFGEYKLLARYWDELYRDFGFHP